MNLPQPPHSWGAIAAVLLYSVLDSILMSTVKEKSTVLNDSVQKLVLQENNQRIFTKLHLTKQKLLFFPVSFRKEQMLDTGRLSKSVLRLKGINILSLPISVKTTIGTQKGRR